MFLSASSENFEGVVFSSVQNRPICMLPDYLITANTTFVTEVVITVIRERRSSRARQMRLRQSDTSGGVRSAEDWRGSAP